MPNYSTRKIEDPAEYQALAQSFDDYHLAESALWFKTLKEYDGSAVAYALLRRAGKDKVPLFLGRVRNQKIMRFWSGAVFPFGPLVNLKANPTPEELTLFTNFVKQELSEKSSGKRPAFVYFDPFMFDETNRAELQKLFSGCKGLAPARPLPYRHGDGTIIYSTVGSPEEVLLPSFRKGTRHDLRRALKKDLLEVKKSASQSENTEQSEADFDTFWDLYLASQERLNFVDHRKNLYHILVENGDATTFLAREKATGAVVAGVFAVLFKEQNTFISLLSANTHSGNQLLAPTLIRWTLFNWAHDNGFKRVDLFAVRSSMSGYTFFKTGLGGETIWYDQPYIHIINRPIFTTYNLIRKS